MLWVLILAVEVFFISQEMKRWCVIHVILFDTYLPFLGLGLYYVWERRTERWVG